MTHKTYYQAAASEVADGVLDDALWTKVSVELAGQDNVVRQAKYIQLRAQEMAVDGATHRVRGVLPRVLRWAAWSIGALVVFTIIVNVFDFVQAAR